MAIPELIAAAAAVLLAWLIYRIRANHRLARSPVRDVDGEPYPRFAVRLPDGEEVGVIDAGSGPVLLLIPGADGIRETWRYQIPALAERFRVIAPDLRSTFPAGASFDLLRRDAEAVLEARGAADAGVVGQSLGGAIAAQLALESPARVRSLVIVNSLARVDYGHVGLNRTLLVPLAIATTRYFPTVLARLFARLWSRLEVWVYDASPGSERVIDYALWTGPRTVPPRVSSARVALLRGRDLRPRLPAVSAPTLVVKGPRDTYVPVSWSREIAAAIPGAEYVEIPGTGHCSHISMPEAFNRVLIEWLKEAEA